MVVDTPVVVLALSLQFLVLVVYVFLFLFCPCTLATLNNVTVRQVDLGSLFFHELFLFNFGMLIFLSLGMFFLFLFWPAKYLGHEKNLSNLGGE